MEKEFEALDRLYCEGDLEQHKKDYEFLKQALTELQAIKEAKPSKALEYLEDIKKWVLDNIVLLDTDLTKFDTIEQALLKAQEQEKVLEIIKEKNVNIVILKVSENVEAYNVSIINYPKWQLTQEEFNLLKRWCEK